MNIKSTYKCSSPESGILKQCMYLKIKFPNSIKYYDIKIGSPKRIYIAPLENRKDPVRICGVVYLVSSRRRAICYTLKHAYKLYGVIKYKVIIKHKNTWEKVHEILYRPAKVDNHQYWKHKKSEAG